MIKKIFTLSFILIVFSSTVFSQQSKVTTDLRQVKQLFNSSPVIPDMG